MKISHGITSFPRNCTILEKGKAIGRERISERGQNKLTNPLFTPEELAELAAFDAEVEKEEITQAETEKSRSRDQEVMFDRKNNRERRNAARKREYRAANKEKLAAWQREYNAANKEKIAAQKREYYAANKEKIAAQKREYRAAKRIKKALVSAPPPTRADQRTDTMIPQNGSNVQ